MRFFDLAIRFIAALSEASTEISGSVAVAPGARFTPTLEPGLGGDQDGALAGQDSRDEAGGPCEGDAPLDTCTTSSGCVEGKPWNGSR